MEPEGSLPHSQVPATCPYSWASMIQSILPHPTSWRSFLILSSHPRLGLPSGLFPSGFPTKTLCTPLLSLIRATCPSHLILLDFIHSTATLRIYRSYPPPPCAGRRKTLAEFVHSSKIRRTWRSYERSDVEWQWTVRSVRCTGSTV